MHLPRISQAKNSNDCLEQHYFLKKNQKQQFKFKDIDEFVKKYSLDTSKIISNQGKSFWERDKKQKQYMQFSKLTPCNLESEKKKFFQNKFNYNPQFKYNLPENLKFNEMPYQICHNKYLDTSLKILYDYMKNNVTNKEKENNYLSQEETEKIFKKYIQELNLQEILTIEFQENVLVPTYISHKKQESKVIIRLPITYTKNSILGTLNHEIGTHFVRKYNDKLQKNYQKIKQMKSKSYIKDEEGLAVINQLYQIVIDNKKKPYLFKSALNYYAAYLASQMSFKEIFSQLEQFLQNPDKRFTLCMRVKRGIKDTSQIGGMYKDQVYLIGAIGILNKRKQINFELFHQVKLNFKDFIKQEKLKQLSYDEKMIKPYFLKNIQVYNRVLDKIALVNYVD